MKASRIYNIVKILFSLLILFFTTNLYSQSETKKLLTKITVHVQDSAFVKVPLTLKLFKDYINSNTGAIEYTVLADKNGNYHFPLKNVSKMMWYAISYQPLSYGFSNGYVEPGDNIVFDFKGNKTKNLQPDDFTFSGNGSAKYLVKTELRYTIPNKAILTISDNKSKLNILKQYLSNANSNYYFYKNILDKYKTKISRNAYDAMNADIYGRAYSPIFGALPEFLNSSENQGIRDSIILFQSNLQSKPFDGYSIWALQSQDYLTFIKTKARCASIFKHNSTKLQDVYKELILQNDGKVREKVLMNYLIGRGGGQKGNSLDSVYLDALKYVQNPIYRNLLIELSSALKVGSPAYPFTLPDSTGKMVSLKDFAGKLVIVDCWFTGCAACAELAKVIDDQVLPKYIDNKNVVFVSVCVDKTVEKWKTSLKSGEYTNAKSINLFTEGLALNHPFIKNYQFHGFPQLILIDKKGNIFTPALPREPGDMIEVIEQALKAN